MKCVVCGENFYDPDNIPFCRICYKELHLQKYVGPVKEDENELMKEIIGANKAIMEEEE